jgi:hypothetical protein
LGAFYFNRAKLGKRAAKLIAPIAFVMDKLRSCEIGYKILQIFMIVLSKILKIAKNVPSISIVANADYYNGEEK